MQVTKYECDGIHHGFQTQVSCHQKSKKEYQYPQRTNVIQSIKLLFAESPIKLKKKIWLVSNQVNAPYVLGVMCKPWQQR